MEANHIDLNMKCVIDFIITMNQRKKLINESTHLNQCSKVELFNFISDTLNISFMENTNGIFFSLNEISDENIDILLEKINKLKECEDKHQNLNNNTEQDESVNLLSTLYNDDKVHNKESIVVNTCKASSFNYDKNIVKELENQINKSCKKSIHVKYSLAKKKYNKQTCQVENKKIDNTDLNELKEEKYIL
jgi:hypothetical protein